MLTLDLHGKTVKEARKAIHELFIEALRNSILKLFIITGRGNHINSDGSFAVLKGMFHNFIRPYVNYIAKVEEEVGAYKVSLRTERTGLYIKEIAGSTITPLMRAILSENILEIQRILKETPSMLKKRDNLNHSVFHYIDLIKNKDEIVKILYQHLEPHKREMGYTGLFPEYRATLSGMIKFNLDTTVRVKKDMIVKYIRHIKSHDKGETKLPALELGNYKKLHMVVNMNIILYTLKRNTIFRHAFFDFNNKHKEKFAKRYKHEIKGQAFSLPEPRSSVTKLLLTNKIIQTKNKTQGCASESVHKVPKKKHAKKVKMK
ncbi:MAG: Smr/MutS family protein [Legionellales bacterium]|jgi:hypothetical protein